jgi:hypothetical protein
MQFQVQDHKYFLHFDRDEGRWFIFESTLRGFRRTAVIDDEAHGGDLRYVIAPDEEQEQVVN